MVPPRRKHIGGAGPLVSVCIPTIGESPYLPLLVRSLQDDDAVQCIDLYINEQDAIERVADLLDNDKVYLHPAEPRALYPSWNDAIRRARETGVKLAILNDDIALPIPNSISRALQVWDEHPEVAVLGFDHTDTIKSGLRFCRGSYRHGGVPGFAFMVDPTKVVEADERFQWWGGDDDIFFHAERDGHKLARCWVRVQHSAETTASKRSWTHEVRDADRAFMKKKWGDAW